MGMTRHDSQRQKLYRAEGDDSVPKGIDFKTEAEAQKYTNRLLRQKWWRKRYPKVRELNVFFWGGECNKAKAHYYGKEKRGTWAHFIKLPIWGRNERVLLHEIAHHACRSVAPWDEEIAPHGREYAKIFLELMRHCMSKEAAAALKASFKKHRVKYCARKRRSIKAARKFVADRSVILERLAKARAARAAKKRAAVIDLAGEVTVDDIVKAVQHANRDIAAASGPLDKMTSPQ